MARARLAKPRYRITAEMIEAARTPKGGWTQATVAAWGVPWPLPKGWRKQLIHNTAHLPEQSPTPAPGPAIFPAARESSCGWCASRIYAGDMITGRRGHGFVHDECSTAIDQAKR